MNIGKTALALATSMFVGSTGAGIAADAFNWSGFYVGGQAGYGFGDVKSEEMFCVNGNCGHPDSRFEANYTASGKRAGVHIGYNHQVGTIVFGGVADLNVSRIGGSGMFDFYDGTTGTTTPGDANNTTSFAYDWEGSVRLKAGVVVDRLMPYLTAGVAFGHGTQTDHRVFPPPDLSVHDFSNGVGLLGATVGAGLAYAIDENLIVHGELRHTNYGSRIVHQMDATSAPDIRTSLANTSIEVGLSFKF